MAPKSNLFAPAAKPKPPQSALLGTRARAPSTRAFRARGTSARSALLSRGGRKATAGAHIVRTKQADPGVTHDDLSDKFVSIGQVMASRPVGTFRYRIEPGSRYREGVVESLLRDAAARKDTGRFGGDYRRVQKAQDELVSTSSVRELMAGVQKDGPISQKQLKALTPVFEEISKLRFPTAFSGFSLNGIMLQHPTRKGAGIFSIRTGLHNARDLARGREVCEAMGKTAKNPKATAFEIAEAGMLASIAYTLNEFTGPAAARNMTNLLAKDPKRIEAQTVARETLKTIFKGLGGQIQAGEATLDAEWKRSGQRIASPRRQRWKGNGQS